MESWYSGFGKYLSKYAVASTAEQESLKVAVPAFQSTRLPHKMRQRTVASFAPLGHALFLSFSTAN